MIQRRTTGIAGIGGVEAALQPPVDAKEGQALRHPAKPPGLLVEGVDIS